MRKMGIISEINELCTNVTPDGSLSATLRKIIEDSLRPKPSATNHYTVTQLINPRETYFSRLHTDVSIPPELGRKFAWSKHLQNIAGYWFSDIPDFVIGEETLDGKWVGIDKVRGRFDYLIKDSIIEFKTKDSNPADIDEVYSVYPQDLEQLIFYSIIHPLKPKINYLVFMENSGDFNLMAFRVEINNFKNVEALLQKRILALDHAFEINDPSNLGRCRYYNFGCKFTGTNKCDCDQVAPISTKTLQSSINFFYDSEFTQKLEEARKSYKIKDIFCVTTYNLIAPRKYYITSVLGHDLGTYSNTLSDEYKSCLQIGVNKLKAKLNIYLDQDQISTVKELRQDHRVLIGFRWINYKQSGFEEDQQLPYLIKTGSTSFKSSIKASPYHITELGIMCGLYNKTSGLIFIVYPHLDNLIMTYKIDFKGKTKLTSIVKNHIDLIEESEKKRDPSHLPMCEKFQCPIHTGGSCPLEKECF